MEDHPNYYAVIPAEVRYNEELTANSKLLYGEISALCNKEGFCWANNKYFADLYSVSNSTISRWISQLEKLGFIKTKVNRNDNNEIVSRHIFVNTLCAKIDIPYAQKCSDPIRKNVKENNTSSNNTSSNSRSFQPPTLDEVKAYIQEKSYTVNAERWFAYYESNGWHVGRNKMKDWKASIRYWNSQSKGSNDGYVSEYYDLF